MIDCSGFSRTYVLLGLWYSAKFPPPHTGWPRYPNFDQTLASEAVNGWIYSFQGKIMCVNFSSWPFLNPSGYDSYYGKGAMEKVIDSLRN
jgi:hypothetical protein